MKNKHNKNSFAGRREFLGGTLLGGAVAAITGAGLPVNAQAGTELRDGIPVLNQGKGTPVVFASQTGAALDSNVLTGGGTDDTEILQAVLDKAVEWGSLHLVMDGAALIHGLKVHSNTTIECLNQDCGFFQKSWTNAPMLHNADISFDERKNRNITLLGGTYNHNCLEQNHDYPQSEEPYPIRWKKHEEENRMNFMMEFIGVENFTVRDVTLRDQATFALFVINFYRVTIENLYIDLPHQMAGHNQDGAHFMGPGQFLTIRNIQGRSGDDFISLAPDEIDCVSDITDVLIDGVIMNDTDQGIRLLSRDKGRLDRVIIKNVSGTYRSFGFYIEPWFNATGGNYGDITIDTVDLHTSADYDYRFLFSIGGTVESLTFKNITHYNPSDNRILFDIGASRGLQGEGENGDIPNMNIKSLLIDGLRIYNPTENFDPVFLFHGPVGHCLIRNVEMVRDNRDCPINGTLIKITEKAEVRTLIVSDVFAERIQSLISVEGGKVDSLYLTHVIGQDIEQPAVVISGGSVENLTVHGLCGIRETEGENS
ncbi:MAG: hypothetical protein IKW74_05535 [Thermoguttaceae bacterium]|nr:hypothetical protein [Thermoguttaceae bacterium]